MIDSEMGAGERSATFDVESAVGIDSACAAVSRPAPVLLAAAGIALLLLVTSASGAGVLVWWAVHFHPDDRQLWMVPVGLVLFGTPIVVWFSVFASDFGRRFERRMRSTEVSSASAGDGALLTGCMAPSATDVSEAASGAGDAPSGVKRR